MDRLIVGIMFALIVLNTTGIVCIWRRMVEYDNDYWTTLDDDDDDDWDDEEEFIPPYIPRNRINSN